MHRAWRKEPSRDTECAAAWGWPGLGVGANPQPRFAPLATCLDLRQVQDLEQMLLNASFLGHNLTLQTTTIQSLVFKLNCDFAGLSLSSATSGQVHQVSQRGIRGAGDQSWGDTRCGGPRCWE